MAVPEALQKLTTGKEFLSMPDNWRCELVRGEVVQMIPAGRRHGRLTVEIGARLREYVKERNSGEVCGAETGFYVRRNPDTVRAPDSMYFTAERAARISDPDGFPDIAPDLAAEVLSPGDTWSEVESKVGEYLEAGVRLVWIVDPARRTITVYRVDGSRSSLSWHDTLAGEDVLPGFSVSVSEIFDL